MVCKKVGEGDFKSIITITTTKAFKGVDKYQQTAGEDRRAEGGQKAWRISEAGKWAGT